jgi:hypothetical protein
MPFLSVALAANPPAFGWDTQTHQAITAEALKASLVDNRLREMLGISEGIGAQLRSQIGSRVVPRDISGWSAEGSEREDDYLFSDRFGRFFNHFHHPLRYWPAAGLSDVGSGQSSVLWAQTDPQPHGGTGNWAWQEVRRLFEGT